MRDPTIPKESPRRKRMIQHGIGVRLRTDAIGPDTPRDTLLLRKRSAKQIARALKRALGKEGGQ